MLVNNKNMITSMWKSSGRQKQPKESWKTDHKYQPKAYIILENLRNMQGLYKENFKISLWNIIGSMNKYIGIPCSYIWEVNFKKVVNAPQNNL